MVARLGGRRSLLLGLCRVSLCRSLRLILSFGPYAGSGSQSSVSRSVRDASLSVVRPLCLGIVWPSLVSSRRCVLWRSGVCVTVWVRGCALPCLTGSAAVYLSSRLVSATDSPVACWAVSVWGRLVDCSGLLFGRSRRGSLSWGRV